MRKPTCRHCPGDTCDPEIHSATMSVRDWLRTKLAASLEPVERGKMAMRPMKPINYVPIEQSTRPKKYKALP